MLTFTHTPPTFSPTYTDGLFFTVSADTDEFKFRYVYDVHVNGTSVFQGKATPNPFGLGIIDLSRILKTYVKNNPISTYGKVPIYTHQTFPFSKPYENEVIYYQLYVGYEYASSEIAPVTGFTGGGITGDTIGPPTETPGIYKAFQSTMGVNGRSNQQDFNINPFVLSGTPVGTYPTTSGLFLTNSPRIRNIQESEWYTLAFTNYYLDSSTLSEPYYVEYKQYDDEGNLIITTTFDNYSANGGGPRSNCNQVYQSIYPLYPTGTTTEFNTLYVGAGPQNIEPILHPDTKQYTIQLFGKFTGTTTPIQPTPTPTPSATPAPVVNCSGNCYNYSVSNLNLLAACDFTYYSCTDGRTITVTIPPSTSVLVDCACETYLIYECDLDVRISSNCTESPCDTCYEVIATNNSLSSRTYYYYDCTLGSWTGRTQPSLTGVLLNCVCPTFNYSQVGMSFSIDGFCTSGPTPTPTPTPTCPGYKTWSLTTVTSSCSGGVCTAVEPTLTTVYTDCNVTSITSPSTDIFTDTSLTTPFVGFFSRGGYIYYSDGTSVTEECAIGGPC